MANDKVVKTFMDLCQGKPCVQDLISIFSSFLSGNKIGSEQMTSENNSRVCSQNSDKKQVDPKSADKNEGMFQDIRRNKGERSEEKDIQCKSNDNEKETKSQEDRNEIDNSAELMTCKFCQAQISLNSYNTHIKESHFNEFSKKVNSDNSFVDIAGRKRKQPEKEAEVNATKVQRCNDDTIPALDNTKNDTDLSAWHASFIPKLARAIVMYLCKTCTLATAVYDSAVEHAQDHLLNLEIKTELCEICNLKFNADFKMHQALHADDDDIDRDSFKYVLYTYADLMKPEWLNMFDTLPKEAGDKIKSASIYFPSRCIRLRLQNDSNDASEKNTLFKCVTCNNYVDPQSLESHINNCSKKLSGHLCHTCNRPFITEKAKDQHSLVHEDPNANKNFRIVLFNDQRHLSFNKTLLQSAGKLVLVDEGSHKSNLEGRNEKQAEVNATKVQRCNDDTIPALDNTKNDTDLSAWHASFIPKLARAIVMYLCKTCTLATAVYDNAVKHAQDHLLNLEIKSELCEICNLKFNADFKMHQALHAGDDDIDRDSFKYVLYDFKDLIKPEWLNMFDTLPKEAGDKIKSASIYFPSRCIRLRLQNDSKDASEKNTLFKCVTCNNYVDPQSLESHINNCSKKLSGHLCHTCNRPFITEKAKDQHSLVHEDPNANKNFRIVLFNDQRHLSFNKTLLQSAGKLVLVDEGSQKTNVEGSNEKQNDLNEGSSKVANDVEGATKHKVNNDTVEYKGRENVKMMNVYQCQCGLCFHTLQLLWCHIEICSPAFKPVRITCKCGLVFDDQDYCYHCELHRSGITKFNVKGVSVHDKGSVEVSGMIEEFKNTPLQRS